MNKVRYPNGSEVNFEQFIDDLQKSSFNNLKKRIQALIQSGGIFLDVNNGVVASDFKASFVNSEQDISVNTGIGLTASGEFLKIATPLTVPTITPTNACAVILRYKELGSKSVKAMNAFVYDVLGSGNSLNRKTAFEDSIEVRLIEFSGDYATFRQSLDEYELPIAVFWSNGTANTASSFGLDSFNIESGTNFSSVDVRINEKLLLSEAVLSDKDVLFKDRDSVGDNAYSNNLEISGSIQISGILKFLADIDYEIYTEGSSIILKSPTNDIFKLEDDTLKVHKLRVNRGTYQEPIWDEVVTKGEMPSKPHNMRIFDIYPTDDHSEKKGYIKLKWNWDGLNVENSSNNWIEVSSTSYFKDEEIAFTTEQIGEIINSKEVYFSKTGDSYLITNIEQVTGGWRIYLSDFNAASETTWTTTDFDARVVDTNLDRYHLNFKSDSDEHEVAFFNLDSEYRTSPKAIVKLELGKDWHATLQNIGEGNRKSSTVTMGIGEFKPYNNTANISYGSPFSMSLPEIVSTGSIDVKATIQGFYIIINGWSQAHEYEILYSDTVILTDINFDTLENAERIITPAKKVHIPASVPTRHSIIVRPLQNKYPVKSSKEQEVISGGSGLLPTEQILYEDDFSVDLYRGKVIDKHSDFYRTQTYDYYDYHLFSGLTGTGMYTTEEQIHGKRAVWSTLTSNQITGFTLNDSKTSLSTAIVKARNITAPGAPNAKRLEFYVESTGSTTDLENSPEDWSKIETNTMAVQPSESVVFEVTPAVLAPWKAKLRVELVKVVAGEDDEILGLGTLQKDHGPASRGGEPSKRRNIVINYIHQDPDPIDVKVVFRGWVNRDLGYTASETHQEGISILVDTQYGYPRVITPYSADFGRENGLNMFLGKETYSDESNSSYLAGVNLVNMEMDNFIYRSGIPAAPAFVTKGTEFLIGTTKLGRFIAEKSFDVDIEVTGLEMFPYKAEGSSPNHPAIVRVYPKNSENSAVSIEVQNSAPTSIKQSVNLKIQQHQGERALMLDAFDPDSTFPNNYAQLGGRIIVKGKPVIKNVID